MCFNILFQGCADVWNKTSVKQCCRWSTETKQNFVLFEASAHPEIKLKQNTDTAWNSFTLYLVLSWNWNETKLSAETKQPTVGSFVLFQFLPARRYASASNSDRNLSVCLSVTRLYCVKTKKASDMISSPSGSPKTPVFCRQISSPNTNGFPLNGGLKQGSVGKIQRFSDFKRQYLENGSRYGQSYY